jgi:hypothetical protein
MATFVLNPPAGVRVVSFFVTSRFADQRDHTGFVGAMLEQLAGLLGEPVPAGLHDATRDGHLWSLLEKAAEQRHQQGERLVLVVDGLDEDRGVTEGPESHSIAALLPAEPPHDMRIIVSGRLQPPVPDDVPEHHPLRRAGIVRSLTESPAANVRREDMQRELKFLLRDAEDVIGLMTAAEGS